MPNPKPSIVLFAFLAAVITAFASMMISRFFISKDSGLVGGAMVFWYGIFGFLAGLFMAIVGQKWLNRHQLKVLNIVLGGANVVLIGWLFYRIQ